MTKKDDIKNKKIKGYLLDIASKDEKKQIAAVKSLKIHGNETVVKPVVEALINVKSELVIYEIEELLNTAKSSKVPAEVVKCLADNNLKDVHRALLASIWNSGLDYSQYLKEIVSATVNGEFMSAMECVTIIENMESGFPEDQLMEAILILREYIIANKNESGSKMDLLKEILVILQDMNEMV